MLSARKRATVVSETAPAAPRSAKGSPRRNRVWSELATYVEPGARRGAPALQAKLRVSSPGDSHEREADQVAEHLLSIPEPGVTRGKAPRGDR